MLQKKLRFIIGLLSLLVSFSSSNLSTSLLHAQEKPIKPKPKTELPAGITWEFDVPYIKDGDAAQRLDIYYPEQQPKELLPLIVHIHGGGWMGGSKYPCEVCIMPRVDASLEQSPSIA